MIRYIKDDNKSNGHAKKVRGRRQNPSVNGQIADSDPMAMGGEIPADILIMAQRYFPSMFNSDMKMRPTLTEMVYAYTNTSVKASRSFKKMYPWMEFPVSEDLEERKRIDKELKSSKRNAEYFLTWIKDEMKNRGEITDEQEKKFAIFVNVIPRSTEPLR